MATKKDPLLEVPAVEEVPVDPAEELITIRLPLTRENQADVFVRVNNRTWLIKRGETVQLPRCAVEVLENSERAVLEGMEYQAKMQHD